MRSHVRFLASFVGALAVGGLLTACDTRTPGGDLTPDPDLPDTPDEPGQWLVETFAQPMRLAAGGEVSVQCVVSQGRQHLPGVPTQVVVTPDPGPLTAEANGARFTPTIAADYSVRCQTADQSVADVEGVVVEVSVSIPAAVETELDTTISEAGAPVGVMCTLFDAYGNELEASDYADTYGVQTTPGLLQDPPSGAGFIVRGTLAGPYDVACNFGGLVDVTPEELMVTPGIPADTDTLVVQNSLSPTEPTSVSCVVTDAYGNVLEGYDTTIQVMVADGSPPAANGLALSGSSLSATKAGTYYVSCRVDGFFAADESPAVVDVHPGLPANWIVELPEQDCFWQNRRLPLLFVVYDAWGNEIDADDYSLEVWSTPGGAVLLGQSVLISSEGDFTVWVDLGSGVAQDPASSIVPQGFSIRVDSTPPVIALSSPARSATLEQAGATVNITGTASDGISALESLQINGAAIAVSPGSSSQAISRTQSSVWGLNVITGEAVDECGNRRVMAQSYLRSGAYFTAATSANTNARVPTGILARLNQPVIDDGNRADLDDLASIGEAVLLQQNFNTLIPPGTVFVQDPLDGGCSFCEWWADYSYWVRRNTNANYWINWYGPWLLYLRADYDAISLSARLENFDFPLQASGSLRECACGVQATQSTGTINAWAGADRVDATGSLGIWASGSNVNVAVNSLTLNTTGLYLDLDCGWADFLCDIIVDIVLPYLESTIEDALADAVAGEIPPLIDGFLSSFALDTGFALPAPLNMNLNLSSAIDYLDFDGPAGSGNGEMGLFTQIYPGSRGASIPFSARGAVRRDGTAPSFSSFQYSFGLALKDDLLNQALWAVWYGGALDLNLSEILSLNGGDVDLSGVNMTMRATLPPVVMPGSGINQVYIGIGDMRVDATVDLAQLLGAEASGAPPLTLGLYLSAIVGGSLDIDPTTNEILVALDPEPQIYVEVVQIDDEGYQGVMTDLFAALLRIVVPRLLGDVLGAIPIPEFDLSALGLPVSNAVLSLTNGSLGRPNTANSCVGGTELLSAGHFCMTGSLQ